MKTVWRWSHLPCAPIPLPMFGVDVCLFQPDEVGIDIVMLDLRSDRNDGNDVAEELLDGQAVRKQQCMRVYGRSEFDEHSVSARVDTDVTDTAGAPDSGDQQVPAEGPADGLESAN